MNSLDPYNFLFELPLYSKIHVTPENNDEFTSLLTNTGYINAYSSKLKENTTYNIEKCPHFVKVNGALDFWRLDTRYGEFQLRCQRAFHTIRVYIYIDTQEKTIEKIGQYPSIADMHISKIKMYDKVLPKEKLKEFTRAIGLAANGVGIGSFVYLRRIFEHLIEESFNNAKVENNLNSEEFYKLRINEKVEFLKDYLPEFLSENKSLYGILSLGIHELSENECLQHFEIVKVGIELILDEKVEVHTKTLKIQEAKRKLEALTNRLNQRD